MINASIMWSAAALLLPPYSPSASAQTATQTAPVEQAGERSTSAGISQKRFQKRQERKLLAADTDGDARVSKAEFLAANSGQGDPAKRFAKFDRNGDGNIDKAEIDARLARRFQRLDTSGDGVVNAQERSAARVNIDAKQAKPAS